ncbi:CopG family transcriptional regulator [Microcoleus asticus]|nr:CopG family transcriptional regulator [Microcoleus asticus]
MSTKKRRPLGSAMKEFVFGTKKEAAPQTPPEVISPAPTPTASLTPEAASPATPPRIALPTVISSQPAVSAPEPVSIQSKEPSLMTKLQAPDKEATVRFTVDMSETLHRKLSMLAARTGRKKVDIVRMLLEEGLKEVEG